MAKQSYYRTLTILVSIIILLIVFLVSLLMNPIIETEIVEIPKEVIVEKEIEIIVEKEVQVEIETEVIVEKIVEVEKEVIIEVEPTYAYNVTSEERELLARIVYREANIESLDCQKAVASVVINRWKDGYWGDTLEEVIYADQQFSPAYLIPNTTPTNTNYEAVDYVLKNGCTVPEYVMFFRAAYHFSWTGYVPYQHIDNTYFGYNEYDKK